MTVSPIDSSTYSYIIDSIATFPRSTSLSQTVSAAYTEDDFSSPVNLSNYYSDLENSDLLKEVANNVSESAENLDNVIMQALNNGMGIEDAINVNKALNCYKANCVVAKSTFELKI